MRDRKCREELDRLKLRLFGEGHTDCMNVSTWDRTDSILGGHRRRVADLENQVEELKLTIEGLKPKRRKSTSTKKKKKK